MKTLLVVFGVLIMFAFVVLDPMVQYLGGGRVAAEVGSRRDGGDVAVTWKGGSLTNNELENLVMRRRIVDSFIRGVGMGGIQLAIEAGAEPREPRVAPLLGPTTPEQGVEQSVVHTALFAQAARDAGMRVSDDTIRTYLDELGGGRVTREHMSGMLKQLGGGAPVNYIFDAIREEMLARNYLASHSFAFETVTPEQRYEDWLRVNDRVVIEAAPIAAESFLVDVPDPSPTELKGFFDEHKQRESGPVVLEFPGRGRMEFPSPTPGFRIPRKIDVQYIEANYDEFLAKVEAEITEEQIAKHYEENKDPLFIKADTDLIDDPEKPQATEQPADAPVTNSATEPATDRAAESEEAAADEAAAPETGTEAPSQDGDDAPAAPAQTSTEPAAPTDAADDEAASNEEDQSSILLPGGIFGVAALLQQQPDDNASPPPAAVEPSTEAPSSADQNAAPQSPAPSDNTDQSSAANDPAGTTAEPSSTGQPPTEFEQDTAEKSADPKPVEFQTLDEVRDQIRRDLARARVSDQIDVLMNQLFSELDTEWTKYFSSQLEAQAAEREAPAPPAALANLAPLAEKHGLKYGKTGPMSFLELRATPVGKSGDSENQELWAILFAGNDIDPYQPVATEDVNANRYLAMKISDTPGHVPELDKVRADVVRAWKLEKAAELALKEAADQAKKAQDARAPLAEFFTGGLVGQVVRTDPFALYTGGDVALASRQLEPFRLSEPAGVVAAGPEFMEKVFQLKDGEVTAVMNHDHSIAYVVRLVEHELSPEELRTAYLAEAATWPGMQIMTSDRYQRSLQMLGAEILERTGLKWKRSPDPLVQDEEE
jgi:hypothetical protein